jgi:hypothetical protein
MRKKVGCVVVAHAPYCALNLKVYKSCQGKYEIGDRRPKTEDGRLVSENGGKNTAGGEKPEIG